MRTYLDCFPCFVKQMFDASAVAGMDENQRVEFVQHGLVEVGRFETTGVPCEMSSRLHAMVREATRNGDPYRTAKDTSTKAALDMYPYLKSLVQQSSDPLEMAVRLSIAGNIIDLGVPHEFDLESTVERVLTQPFAINDLPAFRDAIARSSSVLYLGDNAGETVFDRLLIETLPLPVTYVVKASATVNDATREDAVAAGLHGVATIVDNGSDGLGTLLYRCSPEFVKMFQSAEIIIGKGHANFESLDGSGAPVFYLLQAKCQVIAGHLGVQQYDIILRREPPAV